MKKLLLLICIALTSVSIFAQWDTDSDLIINDDGSASYIIVGDVSEKLYLSMTKVAEVTIYERPGSGSGSNIKKVSRAMNCSKEFRDRMRPFYQCEIKFKNLKAGVLK